jgi:PadR family transcriptional regulator, regulatory protein PadR
MAVNKELMKGNAQTMVLKLLSGQAMYGYLIAQKLHEISNSSVDLQEGSLYPLLHSLEKDGAVEAYWEEKEGERRRKYYKITPRGRKLLKEKKLEWESFRTAMDLILTEAKTLCC